MSIKSTKYRPEIDGLRAISVLAVLIFHINPSYLPGGFIGVDVFFVISGFLIMSIVKKQVEEGSFSYKEFYTRRIKRLLPLFFSVVVFCLIAGYFLLLPVIYRNLARDITASNVFLANFSAAFTGNYFDSDQIKPTVHFWSLAIEEQFYFIMPTLFILLYKFARKYIVAIFIILFISSLILSQVLSSDPKFATFSYFLLPTRMWELLAGCLLAFASPKENITKYLSKLSLVGMGLIVVSLFIINEHSIFPGYIAILPILGSVLIISAGGQNLIGKILSTKPFLVIGKASYSIYMWHWPIIIFIKIAFNINQFSVFQFLFLLIAIILVGILSQIYIEDYFRFKKGFNFKKSISYYYIVPFLVTTCFSLFLFASKGMPSRYDLDPKVTVTATTNCPAYDLGCFITENTNEKNKVLMIGDSHAIHFANLFTAWFNQYNIALKLYATGGCNFYSKEFYSNACETVKKDMADEIFRTEIIIIAKRFDLIYKDKAFLNDFYGFINGLTEQGKKVVLLSQVPKFKQSGFLEKWMVARRYNSKFDYNEDEIDEEYSKANTKIFAMFKNNDNITFLDFNKILIKNGKPLKFDDQNGLPLYYNSNHLTAYGAEWIYERVKNDPQYRWLIDLIKQQMLTAS